MSGIQQGLIASYPGASGIFSDKAVNFINTNNTRLVNTSDNTIGLGNDFAIEIWYKHGTLDKRMLSFWSTGSGPFIDLITDIVANTTALFFANGNGKLRDIGTTLTSGTTYHIIFTWNGTDINCYLNGNLDNGGYRVNDGAVTLSGATTYRTAIGDYGWTGYQGLGSAANGVIKSIACWNTSSITPSQLYDGGNGWRSDKRTNFNGYTQTSNLQHYWELGSLVSPNIGDDLGNSPLHLTQVNITDSNIVTFP